MPPRFVEILQLLADGLNLNEIAEARNVGVSTVKNDVKQMRDSLGADSNCQAVAMAIRRQIIA